MPDKKPVKKISHPKKKHEVLESADQTVIDSHEAEELEGKKEQIETKESIYEELLDLGFTADKSTWNGIGVISVLVVTGLLIGGLIGIYDNTQRQQEAANQTKSSTIKNASLNNAMSNLAKTGSNSNTIDPRCVISGVVVNNDPTPLTSNSGGRLSQTGGLNEISPAKPTPTDSIPNNTTVVTQTGTQTKSSATKMKSNSGQFTVTENPDGSVNIKW